MKKGGDNATPYRFEYVNCALLAYDQRPHVGVVRVKLLSAPSDGAFLKTVGLALNHRHCRWIV